MKLKYELMFGIAACAMLSACGLPKTSTPVVKVPDVNVESPKADFSLLESFKTCNKSDAELNLSQLDLKESVVVKDKIENKDIIDVDCDQKQTPKGRGQYEGLVSL